MKIVHFALGFPPYRTGGMIKYCLDLAGEEARQGNTVLMLWPGKITNLGRNISIKQNKNFIMENGHEVKNFEIINPLPVSLLDGIEEFGAYMQEKEVSPFEQFLVDQGIDVLHVHTLMGFSPEILIVCRRLGIKTIFTSHDYFGLCAKWGLEKNGNICSDDHNCFDCIQCNKSALSLNKIKFLQSPLYRYIKDIRLIRLLRKKHNTQLYLESYDNNYLTDYENNSELATKYQQLRAFYVNILMDFDIVHYNSSNTMHMYSKYFDAKTNGSIINISHATIENRKKLRNITNIVRFGYLGPIVKHKGYFFLKEVCDKLDVGGYKFELHIFADTDDQAEYLKKHDAYKYEELEEVMKNFDVLVVPSLWAETFGFTVLEALSFAVPVIVTKNVGAKDLVHDEKSGFIVSPEVDSLFEKMKEVIEEPQLIKTMNQYIVEHVEIKTMERHTFDILQLYQSEEI